MKRLIKLYSIFAIVFLTSCSNSDTYLIPENPLATYNLVPTKTVQELNTQSASASTPINFTTDDIIEAYVTSSDEQGTFFKSISFQTLPVAGTNPVGFSIPVNVNSLYAEGFSPGRKVFIKLNGLDVWHVFGSMQIGIKKVEVVNGANETSIDRISETRWKDFLFISDVIVDQSILVRKLTVQDSYRDFNINTLIDIEPVQFSELSIDRKFYDKDDEIGGATNHLLQSTTGGTEQIIRFSSFAPFNGKTVPSGSGTIRGVLTKYRSDYQFVIRFESDIKLTNPRQAVPSLPLGGSAIVFNSTLNETFTSFALNNTIFPPYINDQTLGNRYWAVKNFSNNNYIEMSSFGGGGVNAKSYFFVPVNFTIANKLKFKEKMRFYRGGEPLRVYYVKEQDYSIGSINKAAFVNITANVGVTYPGNGLSEADFNSSVDYQLPAALTGNGYFVFEYVGTPTLTTTVQLDDIIIE